LDERLLVLVADGLGGDRGIAQGHAVVAMTEEVHDADETHASAEELGGIGCDAAGDW